MSFSFDFQTEQSFSRKFFHLNWGLVALVTLIAAIGFMALYSAANGNLDPWASKQIIRFCVGFIIMLGVAMIDIRFWYRMSYPIFIIGFVLLVIVEFMGQMGMGAQRWINLGFIQIQPSELMKLAIVMAMARYFHTSTMDDTPYLCFYVREHSF
jgi:rod shape determining protein RodA